MPFQIIRNDITKVKADVIVNTANPEPVYAGGTDRAVYEAAGAEALLAERKKIGAIERGEIAVTDAFGLKARYIIHAVGPVWKDGKSGEFDVLASCYRKSLSKAFELGCGSIAFPLMATGVYGFPKDQALQIAIREISSFLLGHELVVYLVVFDRASFELSGKVFENVAALIDDASVRKQHAFEYGDRFPEDERSLQRIEMLRRQELTEQERLKQSLRMSEASSETDRMPPAPCCSMMEMNLEELLDQKNETFQQCLFRMIDERGLKDSDVYTKANIDRKHFSKIRCNPDYHPKKKTAVALAIALELSMEETVELLSKAEWALSSSSKFDIIVSYFIQNKNYDILWAINPVLFKYNQPTLGA
ncbi:MAG: macro domain-containing protein [Clostridia bacterium]|nr:macro domain-containing protein [Clostridia bacterium]